MQNDTVHIQTPDWMYTFDLVKKTGKKNVNPQKYMIEEYNKLYIGGKKSGHEKCPGDGRHHDQGHGWKDREECRKDTGV